MTNGNGCEIFDLDNIGSVIRRAVADEGEIDLRKFCYAPYQIPSDFEIEYFDFLERDPNNIMEIVEPIRRFIVGNGYDERIFTGVYEALRNAFEHGNRKDRSKKVMLGYKVDDSQLEILVGDEGGVVNPHFLPFILRQRVNRYKSNLLDFYSFAGLEKPQGHSGIGTYVVHWNVDEVNYYISESGGLIVHMVKRKTQR